MKTSRAIILLIIVSMILAIQIADPSKTVCTDIIDNVLNLTKSRIL